MLIPKKLKHRKQFRGKRRGFASRGAEISFGQFGLKATTANWISSRQIEAARRAMIRYIRRGGKVWIRVFPDKAVTSTPAETGMGGGKGTLDHFVAVIRPGQILFEMDGVSADIAREAMRLASGKLAVRTKFVQTGEQNG